MPMTDPIKVVEGLTILLDLILIQSLRITNENLILCLILGPLNGQQKTCPVSTQTLQQTAQHAHIGRVL